MHVRTPVGLKSWRRLLERRTTIHWRRHGWQLPVSDKHNPASIYHEVNDRALQEKCLKILSNVWHRPNDNNALTWYVN